jgi:hypothetical protein
MCCLASRLLNRFEDVLAQPFAAEGAILTLDISVLLGLAWLDVDLSPKSPPALRGVLWVKSLALGRHLVHRFYLQKFHRRQVAQC